MATFRINVRSQSTEKQRKYRGKDGKRFDDILIGAMRTQVIDLTGRMITTVGLEASERALWLNAIYFQRIVSRTPRDENYSYIDNSDKKRFHKGEANPSAKNDYDKNNDHIQDYWTAKYWRYPPITAKYLRENCGCTFEVFNDPSEIEIIYKEFRDRFFGPVGSRGRANKERGKTTLKGIRIVCDYPDDEEHQLRYKLLEYGGYTGDGIIKKGDKYFHGVANERSIQAPLGMEAKTKAEYESGQFRVPKKTYTKNLLKQIGTTQDITKELEKIIGNKTRISEVDIEKVMSLYGV